MLEKNKPEKTMRLKDGLDPKDVKFDKIWKLLITIAFITQLFLVVSFFGSCLKFEHTK